MELVTLNANKQPEKLVQGWDSLIWSERFNTTGDFQLQTGNVDFFKNTYPEGTLLGLRESNEVMIVETHKIERKKNSAQVLTMTGRSFESVLDRRFCVQSVTNNPGDWNVNLKIPSDVAYYITQQICVAGILDVADIFPVADFRLLVPADYLTTTGPVKQFTVPRGNLLSVVLQLLQTEAKADATTTPATPAVVQHGIRATRSSALTYVSVEIYTGTDRSATVYFDATRKLLDDGTYLFSKIGSATTAYTLGSTNAFKIEKGATTPTGFARRVIGVDATGSALNDDALKTQGTQSVSEAKETAAFDGSINQDLSPYKFGTDYGLGDVVKLVGDYGLSSKARVTEYIRSQDTTGSKGVPTLVTIV